MMGAFGAVVMLVLTAGIVCWTVAALRLAIGWHLLPGALSHLAPDLLKPLDLPPGPPLIAWQPRRSVPWGLVDLIGILLIFVAASAVASFVLRQWTQMPPGGDLQKLTLDQRQLLTAANMAVSLIVLAIGLALITIRVGASWRDFGWSLEGAGRNLQRGLIGFVMLAPPVYALQGVLVYFWKPSAHPLMEMFKGSPNIAFFATLVAAAVVVAPLTEEMLFRILLQGWLERACGGRRSAQEVLFGHIHSEPTIQPSLEITEIGGAVALAPPAPNPFAAPQFPVPPILAPNLELADSAEQPELRGLRAWIPIGISSIIFALLHYSHGPDWVALTLLAAGMGYLYQRTHSIIPSLIVHMCLNGLSMWGLWIQVYELKAFGGG
jgi:membrane protease YdiL (CAAX protease family)